MDEQQNLQNQINDINAKSYNNPLLDAKDGFYLVYNYPGQIVSDYVDDGQGSITKTILGVNYPFFTARHPMEVMWVAESHVTAGTDAGAVTLDIEKLTGTQAPAAGVSILTTTFNMKGTINTVVQKEGKDLSANRQLKNGERLCIKFAGTKTALAGVQVTLYCKFLTRGHYR